MNNLSSYDGKFIIALFSAFGIMIAIDVYLIEQERDKFAHAIEIELGCKYIGSEAKNRDIKLFKCEDGSIMKKVILK